MGASYIDNGVNTYKGIPYARAEVSMHQNVLLCPCPLRNDNVIFEIKKLQAYGWVHTPVVIICSFFSVEYSAVGYSSMSPS